MLQLVRAEDRFSIEMEVEYGLPGASAAFDHVAVSVTQGRRTKRTRYTSIDAAASQYHQAITAQLDAGFVLEVDGVSVAVPERATFRSFPELEQRVEDDPARVDHWSALADAWASAGDPRGDCIHFERALVGLDDVGEYARRKAMVQASRRVRNFHIWGVLGRDAYRLRATLRYGLVERFVLEDELGAQGRSTSDLLALALASPFARFLRELCVANADPKQVGQVLAASPRAGRVSLVMPSR